MSHAFGEAINSMNGYQLKNFGDFTKKWKLVTVRYRADSGEMRFTYANPKAWKHLITKGIDYPKGSVFAKLSVVTKNDLAFPSSKVPMGKRRVQFMVREPSKHVQTDGWGYALFATNGRRLSDEDVTNQSKACAACHRLVSDRGMVFSQPMNISLSDQFASSKPGKKWQERVKFKTISAGELPKKFHNKFKNQNIQVNVVVGELTQNLFSGTLDEIRPLLVQKTLSNNQPSALISSDNKKISLVLIDKSIPCHKKGQVGLVSYHTVPNKNRPILKTNLCEDQY